MLQNILLKKILTYAGVDVVSPARKKLPPHLQKYVVEQNYERYTPEDQAVWRFIMRQLKNFLSSYAHPCYVEGLERTGIEIDNIPRIDEMDQRLSEFGWGAVPVSGFIPPAAFMEFQSLGILPIASDMRSIDHLTYTPAPDIVHEASGHAPILIHPEFANYLKKYAEVARHAIITRDDMRQYETIRRLSDIKENPFSTSDEIVQAEAELLQVNQSFTSVSEAGWLSRMNWWTAEYGLIGTLENPKIYGAGLLSSVGESRECLSSKVRKIPLTIDCIQVGYDITEPQPQLFVTPNFAHLCDVLEQLAERMSFRKGGIVGAQRACDAKTVNTIELNSGLQISGVLESFKTQDQDITFVRFTGPVALAVGQGELQGHNKHVHAQGFSTPLGRLKNASKPLSQSTTSDLERLGLQKGKPAHLQFLSGIEVMGTVVDFTFSKSHLVLIQFAQATVRDGQNLLFDPAWGTFDMAVGENITSVFGGPADRAAYGETEDFISARVPTRSPTPETVRRYKYYQELRQTRHLNTQDFASVWLKLQKQYLNEFATHWLPAIELIELAHTKDLKNLSHEVTQLKNHLLKLKAADPACIHDGLRLAEQTL